MTTLSLSSPYLNLNPSLAQSKIVELKQEPREAPERAIFLKEGESLRVESGRMQAYQNLSMTTSLNNKSIWERIKSYFLAGETLYGNQFTAGKEGGWILLEEKYPGQILSADLYPGEKGIVLG